MDTNSNMQLKVLLDSSGINKKDIAKIQKILNKYTVDVNAQIDQQQLLDSAKAVIPKLKKILEQYSISTSGFMSGFEGTFESTINVSGLEQFASDTKATLSELMNNINALEETLTHLSAAWTDTSTSVSKTNNFSSMFDSFSKILSTVNAVNMATGPNGIIQRVTTNFALPCNKGTKLAYSF